MTAAMPASRLSRTVARAFFLALSAACVPTYSFDGRGTDGGDAAVDASVADAPAGGAPEAAAPDGAVLADSGVDAAADAPAPGADAGVVGEGRISIGGAYPGYTVCTVSGGVVRCQGANDSDQLGRGADAGAPTDLTPAEDPDGGPTFGGGASRVQGGSAFECAQRADQVFCWGANDYGQLGQGAAQPPLGLPAGVQTPAGQLSGVQYFTGSGWQACAVLADGDVVCWGANNFSQSCLPGGASSLDFATPVPDLGGARDIATGPFHTCAAMEPDGHVVCCGRNEERQAGQADASTCSGMPCVAAATQVGSILGARQVAMSLSHTCALLVDGSIGCWGNDNHGQLGVLLADAGTCAGDPCTEVPPRFVRPPAGNFVQVAAAGNATCGLVDSGEVWCWGTNQYNQLGHPSIPGDSVDPVPVETSLNVHLTGAVGVAGGDLLMCAVTGGGVVYCWGLPGTQLFDAGGPAPYAIPTPL
jgi:hypothetical protein